MSTVINSFASIDFFLSANLGETIALIGPSGSGKSYLLDLLQQLYDTFEGQILISDQGIKLLDPKSLHHQVAPVGKQPILFEGTVYENISMGRFSDNGNQANLKQEVIDRAKRVNAHDFIMKLPQQY